MFEPWGCDPSHPTLFKVDREIAVYAHDALPSSGRQPADRIPLWVQAFGLRIEAHMRARQVAWIRKSDGAWLAVALVPVASSNRRIQVTLPMCLDPIHVSTDLTLVQPHERVAPGDFGQRAVPPGISTEMFPWPAISSTRQHAKDLE